MIKPTHFFKELNWNDNGYNGDKSIKNKCCSFFLLLLNAF